VGIDHAIEARQIFSRLGDTAGECWATALYAWLLHEAGLMELAAQYANDAVLIAETLDDGVIASWAFNVLAVVFWTSKQVDRALPWSERAISTLRPFNQRYLLGWWLINLGGIHAEAGYLSAVKNDTPSQRASMRLALNVTAEALTIAEQDGDLWGLALTLCNSAEYHLAIDEGDDARMFLARAVALPDICPRTTAHYLYTKAQYLSWSNESGEALLVSQQALAMSRRIGNTDYESHALKYLSNTYESLKDFEQALVFYKDFYKVQSRLEAEKARMRARVTEAHHRTEHFKALADQASQRAEVLAAISLVDPLTGVGNRRALDQSLADLRDSAPSYGLAIIDLDHFKSINDTFSHAVGDDVLRRLGALLRASLRQIDNATRMGGEEFVLIFIGVTCETVMAICFRLLTCIREAPWSELHDRLHVTASIGVALGAEASDPLDVLALADKRLYVAKQSGRNRVIGRPDADGEPID
jgi:two-component system cell cycle response regulator